MMKSTRRIRFNCTTRTRDLCWLLLKVGILALFVGPFLDSAKALDELFDIYSSPQGLGMGGALTADSTGYTALFYNPAGLAKGESRHWEVTPIAIDIIPGFSGMGAALGTRSLGTYQLGRHLSQNTNQYNYLRFNAIPSVVYHGFGIALLGSYEFAGLYDGVHDDINATTDVGIVTGGAMNFFSNLLKFGFALKAIDRNQLKGLYDPTSFTSDVETSSLMSEGMGYGADLGMMLTLPYKYLPTVGVAWRDAFNTYFHASHMLNSYAVGTPDPVLQSVNTAFSIHPFLGRGIKSTIAVEYDHWELSGLPWRKKLHLGVQLVTDRSFYFWLGMNQMYPTFGIALRVKGGNLEVGTYAEDVGYGTADQSDRRMFMRYTIGF